MNNRLYEIMKPITAITRVEPGATTTTDSRGIPLTHYRKALVRCRIGNQVAADTDVTCSVREADNAAGAASQNIGDAAATPTVVFAQVADGCIADANIVRITCAGVAAADSLIINGVTFTAVATGNDLDQGEFDQTTSDAVTGDNLVLCINNLLPNLVATNNAGAVTIQSREPGAETITVTDVDDITNTVPVTVEVVAYFEVDASALSEGYDRIVVRIATSATSTDTEVDADVILGDSRYKPPAQQAAGSAFS